MKEKIILFGGSFNPFHNGHLHICQKASLSVVANKVIVIPNRKPFYKNNKIEDKHRLKIIELYCKKYNFLELSKIEINKDEYTYTIDTVREFKERNNVKGFKNLYYLVGEDNAYQLSKWKKIRELAQECIFLINKRSEDPFDHSLVPDYISFKICSSDFKDISSTGIKNNIKNNKDISKMVCKKVEKYILENELYN